MSEATGVYVLDTSAWLTLIEDETGADTVQEVLEKARAGEVIVLASFMNFETSLGEGIRRTYTWIEQQVIDAGI